MLTSSQIQQAKKEARRAFAHATISTEAERLVIAAIDEAATAQVRATEALIVLRELYMAQGDEEVAAARAKVAELLGEND